MTNVENWAAAEEWAERALQAAEVACTVNDATNETHEAGNHLSRAFHLLTLHAVRMKTGDPYLTENSPEVREALERIWTKAWEKANLPLV